MQNKNTFTFLPKRLTYFEAPQLSEGELADVKKTKETVGPELDTKELVDKSNDLIRQHEDQLKDLPPEFKAQLHDEIVNYFLKSPGRYEKDEKKGLSEKEFAIYRTDMLNKVGEILKEYAPSEDEKSALEKAKKKSENVAEKADNIKPFEIQDIPDSPGEIKDIQELGASYEQYHGWFSALYQEANEAMATLREFQNGYAEYQGAQNGLKAYQKFAAYFWDGGGKEQRVALEQKISRAKAEYDATIAKMRASKEKLKNYGSALGEVSNKLKQEKIAERDGHLEKIKDEGDTDDIERGKKEDEYRRVEAQKTSLVGQRDQLEAYQQSLAGKQDTAKNQLTIVQEKHDDLGKANGILQAALAPIEEALKNPNLTDAQKEKLEEARKTLTEKHGETTTGLEVTTAIIGGEKNKMAIIDAEKQAAATKSLTLKTHLEEQVSPSLNSINTAIATLQEAKLHYATTAHQLMNHYGHAFENFDNIDKAIDDSVLKNNLSNEITLSSLEQQRKSMDDMKVERPKGLSGLYDATLGVPLAEISGALNWTGETILEQGKALSHELEMARSDMGTVSYIAARIGVEVISLPIGVAGGLFEIGGGLATMVAHPIETAHGLGALVGLNPDVSAGKAWSEMGKALISWEDFKEGRIGVGIGKIFVNIVTTITGAGAVGAGGKAAAATYAAARTAGKGVAKAIGKATVAGVKSAGTFVAEEVGTSVAKAGKTLKTVPSVLKSAPGKLKTRAEFVGTSFKSVGEGLAAQVERLWSGTKLEGVRDAGKLSKIIGKEAAIVDDLGKLAQKYEEFQQAIKKIRAENPGLTEAEIRLKLSKKNPSLLSEGSAYEQKVQQLEQAQLNFENEIMTRVKIDTNTEYFEGLLKGKKEARKAMVDSSKNYQDFQKSIANKDEKAITIKRQFEEAVATGDPEAVRLWKEANYHKIPPEWRKAVDYMEQRGKYVSKSQELQIALLADSKGKVAEPFIYEAKLAKLTEQASEYKPYLESLEKYEKELKDSIKIREKDLGRKLTDEERRVAEGIINSRKEAAIKAIEARLKVARGQIEERLKSLIARREQILFDYFKKVNPDIEMVDAAKGIFRLKGQEIYGSIYSIVDASRSLEELREIVKKVGATSLQGELETSLVIGGSFAQKLGNPFPADIDMAEHLFLKKATSSEQIGQILARNIDRNLNIATDAQGVRKINPTAGLEFIEMKLGECPAGLKPKIGESHGKPKNFHGEGETIKWTREDVERGNKLFAIDPAAEAELANKGYKIIEVNGEKMVQIELAKAAEKPGMSGQFKIDWRGHDPSGNLTEITKVIFVEAPNVKGFKGTTRAEASLQEIHFLDPGFLEHMVNASDPNVLYAYRSFLAGDAIKYGLGEGNYLKASKRMYDLLKVDGTFSIAQELGKILKSDYAHLNQLQDQLGMIGKALEDGTVLEKEAIGKQISSIRQKIEGLAILPEIKAQAVARLKVIEREFAKISIENGVLKSGEIAKMLIGKEPPGITGMLLDESRSGIRTLFEQNPRLMGYLADMEPQKFIEVFSKSKAPGQVLEYLAKEKPTMFKQVLEKYPDMVNNHLLTASDDFIAAMAKDHPEFLKQFENSEFIFEVKDGKVKRITIENNVTLSPEITRLQGQLAKLDPKIKLEPASKLHVTLGHFGIPDELFDQLQKANPTLTKEVFRSKFQQLMKTAEGVMPTEIKAVGTEIAQFDGGAIVLKLDKTPFAQANQRIYNEMIGMLNELGIKNPVEFTANNPNLQFLHPDKFQPHITLGKVDAKVTAAPAGAKHVQGIMPNPEAISITPSYVANTKKKLPPKPS